MKCEMCNEMAEVHISWPASEPQGANVCECCAAIVWNKISTDFSGTESFAGFSIAPLYKHNPELSALPKAIRLNDLLAVLQVKYAKDY